MAATREASATAALDPEATESLYRKLRPGPSQSVEAVRRNQKARVHGALLEVVSERGYDAVTVRELARLAGVSTRTLYEHFPAGKEEVFLLTFDLIVQRAAGRIDAAHQSADAWQEQLSLALGAFAAEIERRPSAARLALVEALTVGPAALERLGEARGWIQAVVEESFAQAPDRIAMPPLLLEGILAGIESVARARLLAGREAELPEHADELIEWALCYRGEVASTLGQCDERFAPAPSMARVVAADTDEVERQKSGDERALILSAVAKLAAAEGSLQLTVPGIRAVAGVSRKSFDQSFASVQDCVINVLELHVDRALSAASLAYAERPTWSEGIHRAIVTLCQCIACDPVLARLGFVEIFSLGAEGVHCRERLAASITELLRGSFPPEQRPSQLTAEATVGAVWGLIHHHIVSGQVQQLSTIAPTLSLLALAPALGVAAAAEVIQGNGTPDKDFIGSTLREASMAGARETPTSGTNQPLDSRRGLIDGKAETAS